MSILNITKDNFREEVIRSREPVLLDFWAPWCGPCRMVSPILEEIAAEHPQVKIGKINVDEEYELAVRFKVASIPTLVVMNGGEIREKAIGARSKAAIEQMLGL